MGIGVRDYMRERRLDYGSGSGSGDGGGGRGGDDDSGRWGRGGGGFASGKGRWWALGFGLASAALAAFGVLVRAPERAALAERAAGDAAAHARALARATEELHSLGFVAVGIALPALIVGVL